MATTKQVKKVKFAKFRMISGVTPKRAIQAVGAFFGRTYGTPSEMNEGKTILRSADSNKGLGDTIVKIARKIAESGCKDTDSVNALFALGYAFLESGKPAHALAKAAGTVLNTVSSEEQATERREIEGFSSELASLFSYTVEEHHEADES